MSSQPQVPTGTLRTTPLVIERAGDPSVFGDNIRADAAEIIARYPEGQSRSALLPMLHLVQSVQGHVTPDGVAFCAQQLDLTHAQVAAVVTFYTMYKRKPTGEYLVSVCTNTLCGLLGGDEIYAALSDALGVGMNETTEDGTITLEHAECLAACDYAPVLTVNYEYFDNQTPDSAQGIVDELRAGTRPLPSRGAPLCTFREISRQIAGFVDERPEALEATATGEPTTIGVRLATGEVQRPSRPASRSDRSDLDEAVTAHRDAPVDDIGEFPLHTHASERAERSAESAELDAEARPHDDEQQPDTEAPDASEAADASEPVDTAEQAESQRAASQPSTLQRRRRSSARGRQRAAADQPSSANDAPLQTAESDDAHPAQPAGQKEEGEA